jgi:RNA polymerase sigma-70 factor (ECF subfamily)
MEIVAAPAEQPLRNTAPMDAWVARLRGRERERAVAELHALLLAGARYVVAQRRSALPSASRAELEEIAVEAADDAVVAILRRLDEFRGESRFTTWAYKFVFFEAAAAVRRRAWRRRELPHEEVDLATLLGPGRLTGGAERRELARALREAIETLTPHQRRVFVAIAVQGVPIDVLAERLGTTRGALYKVVHDSRSKLRAHLTEAGLGSLANESAKPHDASPKES